MTAQTQPQTGLSDLTARITKRCHEMVQLPEDAVTTLRAALEAAPGARVVYVVRHPSFVVRLLLRIKCRALGLPVPEHEDFGRQLETESAEHGMLSLRRRLGEELFKNRRRLKSELLTTLRKAQSDQWPRNTLFVPVTLLAGRGPKPVPLQIPLPLDFSFLPLGEIWSAVVIFLYRKEIRLSLSKPIAFPSERTAEDVIRRISRELYRHEKVIRGAKTHEGSTVENIVLSGTAYERLVKQLSIKGISQRTETERLARKHLHAIEGRFDGIVVPILRRLLLPLFETIFSGFRVEGIENLKYAVHRAPVILLPCHRSHFDYLLVTCAIDRERLALPYIAAGDNLNFFPVGPLLRRSGAFFIRRKVTDDQLYKLILDRYLTYLVKQGQLIEFYIEGGRSRDGSLRQPKLGLLKYIIRTILRGNRKDVVFLPVGITYERVAEDSALVSELLGEKKKRESLSQLLSLRKIREKRFGPVVISFGKGLSLKELLKGKEELLGGIDKIRMSTLSEATEQIALRVLGEIDDLLALSTTGIICSAFILHDQNSADRSEILRLAETLLSIAPDGIRSTPMLEPILREEEPEARKRLLAEALKELVTFGILEVVEGSEHLRISGEGKLRASFYKNTIFTKILLPTLIAERLLLAPSGDEEIRAHVSEAHQRISALCIIPRHETLLEQLPVTLQHLQKQGLIQRDPNWTLTEEGFARLRNIARLLPQ